MIKKIDRYICDRCHCLQDFEEDCPAARSPIAYGWKTIKFYDKSMFLCKNCYVGFCELVDDFLKNN